MPEHHHSCLALTLWPCELQVIPPMVSSMPVVRGTMSTTLLVITRTVSMVLAVATLGAMLSNIVPGVAQPVVYLGWPVMAIALGFFCVALVQMSMANSTRPAVVGMVHSLFPMAYVLSLLVAVQYWATETSPVVSTHFEWAMVAIVLPILLHWDLLATRMVIHSAYFLPTFIAEMAVFMYAYLMDPASIPFPMIVLFGPVVFIWGQVVVRIRALCFKHGSTPDQSTPEYGQLLNEDLPLHDLDCDSQIESIIN